MLRRDVGSILQHVTARNSKFSDYDLNLSGAGDAFLELAPNMKTLLLEILL
jgi:hypothetical protein